MRIVILFNLENGDAIYGNDNGEIRYVSNVWLDQEYFGKLSKDGPKVVVASDRTNKFVLPIPHSFGETNPHCVGDGMDFGSFDRETIELNKYVVDTPIGEYIVRCGYGSKVDTWIIQGTANKISQLPPRV